MKVWNKVKAYETSDLMLDKKQLLLFNMYVGLIVVRENERGADVCPCISVTTAFVLFLLVSVKH